MFKKKSLITGLISLFIFAFGVSSLYSWEVPMVVAGNSGYDYEKPEIGFAPSGAVYIVYREKSLSGGDSDIMMCYYDGKEMTYENVSESASSWARYKSYESDIEVTPDGVVHVAWMAHDRNNPNIHDMRYRYLDGKTWSPIYILASMDMHGGDFAFDLRLGVDSNHNVHVTLYKDHDSSVWYVAKYGNTVLPPESVDAPGARVKHPDIAVDDNYVHLIWMRKIGFPYVIVYQKRENKIGGTVGDIRQITFPKGEYASQKSRIDLDSDGYLHLAEFYKTGIVKKLKYYKEQPNGSFAPGLNLSDPNQLQLYHWASLEVRDNSIIAAMQLGGSSGGYGLYYNWQRNGEWGGYSEIPGTAGCVHQSTDLSADGEVAAIAYGYTTSAIMLVTSAPISAAGSLETEFSHPSMVFWGSAITFDASACTGLNPNYTIATYEWDFGDGSVETTSNPTITHQFNTYGTDVEVTLKITAVTGENGITSEDIYIHALYGAQITSVISKRIRTLFYDRPANEITWTPNQLNVTAGYPAITSFEIWRAPLSTNLSDDQYSLVAAVDTGVLKFLDYFGVQANIQYVYSVRSVDAEGHISPINHISANSMENNTNSTITERRVAL